MAVSASAFRNEPNLREVSKKQGTVRDGREVKSSQVSANLTKLWWDYKLSKKGNDHISYLGKLGQSSTQVGANFGDMWSFPCWVLGNLVGKIKFQSAHYFDDQAWGLAGATWVVLLDWTGNSLRTSDRATGQECLARCSRKNTGTRATTDCTAAGKHDQILHAWHPGTEKEDKEGQGR